MDFHTESAELNSSALGCKVGNAVRSRGRWETTQHRMLWKGVRYNFGTGSKVAVQMLKRSRLLTGLL